MRNLKRNLFPVFYRNLVGQQDVTDEYGNLTGEYIPVYGDMLSCLACVSPNKGSTEAEQFGTDPDYDRTITTVEAWLPIDENTVMWLDGADTRGPYNYIVSRVSRWKNSLQIAVKQVEVSSVPEVMRRG